MAERDDRPHLYGTPDPDNPPPAAEGGMRGERSGEQEDDARTFARTLHVDGREVIVEETSGAVFADENKAKAEQGDREEQAD
ncbi:MAG TPA: hypothetical protein VN137_01885 [Sphingomonas sp.]|nr:hypothetical protein [Sphingomonas sp.]